MVMVFAILLALIFGAFIGSFLNVCIHRLPRNESVVNPPSRCYSCGTHVQWYDNLPLISYIILRGKCRWCDAPFSPRYVILEIMVALMSALIVWWALTSNFAPAPWLLVMGIEENIARAISAAVALALTYFLIVASFIDLEHTIIPDELTKSFQFFMPWLVMGCGVPLAIMPLNIHPILWLQRYDAVGQVEITSGNFLTIFLSVCVVVIGFLFLSLPLARYIYSRYCPAEQQWSEADHRGFRVGVLWFIVSCIPPIIGVCALTWFQPGDWWRAAAVQGTCVIFGSMAGWLALYVVGLLGTVAFKRNAMGFGDVKFLAPIGAILGPVGVVYAFFVAAIVGTVVGLPMRLLRQQKEIPFGPWLAVGALVILIFGDKVHQVVVSKIYG
jgi:leader peptidase (prepilin peptidase) / N-methyltransferase